MCMSVDELRLLVQVVAATVSFAALIAVIISLRQVNKNLKANAIARIYSEIHEIHRVFIEYPELRPFFFNNEPLAESHPHYLRARGIAEMFFDIFEHLYQLRAQAYKEKDMNWKIYMAHMCESSTFLCEYLKENEQLIFPLELRNYLIEKIEQMLRAEMGSE